jgi:hypothetical protein
MEVKNRKGPVLAFEAGQAARRQQPDIQLLTPPPQVEIAGKAAGRRERQAEEPAGCPIAPAQCAG